MSRTQLHIETIDTASWHAVVVIQEFASLDPEIICVGFDSTEARDSWLSNFAPSVRMLAMALPVEYRRRRRSRKQEQDDSHE